MENEVVEQAGKAETRAVEVINAGGMAVLHCNLSTTLPSPLPPLPTLHPLHPPHVHSYTPPQLIRCASVL